MKLRKLSTIILLSGAAILAMSSCGSEGQSVTTYTYTNSISEEDFKKAITCSMNTKDGFTMNEYYFMSEKLNFDSTKTSSKNEITTENSYDAKNDILYYRRDETETNSSSDSELNCNSEELYEYQIQKKDENTSNYINLVNNIYYETKYSADSLVPENFSVFSVVSDKEDYDDLNLLNDVNFSYYLDGDIYTAYYNLTLTKTETNNGITIVTNSDGYFLYQFYVRADAAYAVIDFEYESEETKTKGDISITNETNYIYKHSVSYTLNSNLTAKELEKYTDLTDLYSA